MHPAVGRAAPEFLDVAVEALNLWEVAGAERGPVEDADRVVRVGGCDESVAGIADRP